MAARRWEIDGARSSLRWTVRYLTFANVPGRFAALGGTLDLDEEEPGRSTVEAWIEAASIETGTEARDRVLRGPGFLDVARYPRLTFRSARVAREPDGRLLLEGALTLRGATRPVALAVEDAGRTREGGEERACFRTALALDRRAFGIHYVHPIVDLGGLLIGHVVQASLELHARRAG